MISVAQGMQLLQYEVDNHEERDEGLFDERLLRQSTAGSYQ
jgi:hypothetical protein